MRGNGSPNDTVCMYTNQKRYLTGLLLQKRIRFGKQRRYSRQQGLRPILKGCAKAYRSSIRRTGIRESDGAFIPFSACPPRPDPCRAWHNDRRRWQAAVLTYPAWENYPTGDVVADTRRMNEFIEQRVREMPEQYFWLHKRFKTRPEGEGLLTVGAVNRYYEK